MSQYLLINRIRVQDANAIAGFTWGFPGITHFLGFTHNLSRKLRGHVDFSDIQLSGCAVISHRHQVHTYGYNQFTQNRNPPYLKKHNKCETPPVIEEGKMNLEVSLVIACEGNIGNRKGAFIEWLDSTSKRQRLAGGTILDIATVDLFIIDDGQNKGSLRTLIRRLLPGFILQDRSKLLAKHFHALQVENPGAELFDAWLDFIALKQQARPVSDRINRYLVTQTELHPEGGQYRQLLELWQLHLDKPYDQEKIPGQLKNHFASLSKNAANTKLLAQWCDYCDPEEKTDAVWEYLKKTESGFLVPIMTGYKAISQVYENHQVANTRDNETNVCFVEAIHSIGEWQGIHRIKDEKILARSLWHYDATKKHWYLCKQSTDSDEYKLSETFQQNPDDDFL
jgi:CRISPR-associated protein Csy2